MTSTEDFVILEPMYENEDGILEFMVDPDDYVAIQNQIALGTFLLAFHFQTVFCACIYGVTNKEKWGIDITVYKYIQKNPYNRRMLLNLLRLGHFDIGITRLGSYHLMKSITPYDHDDNSEIVLHYRYPYNEPGNVARYSILWDLFKIFVKEMNDKAYDEQQQTEQTKNE